jgi:Family of unknown function (DUF5681)
MTKNTSGKAVPTGDYEVGHCRPPRHSQFRKGQSGNPNGRPRGSKSINRLLKEALSEKVTVNVNGQRREISKREAIVLQLVNKSAAADLKAVQILLNVLRETEGHPEGEPVDAKVVVYLPDNGRDNLIPPGEKQIVFTV